MLKNKSVSLYNQLNKTLYFFPEPIPETVKIYRGIKNDYIKERDRIHTSWTLNIEEAKRFATYHFKKNNYTPIFAKTQIILELEIKTSDIDLFIIGEEDEVVIKNVNGRFGESIKVLKIK